MSRAPVRRVLVVDDIPDILALFADAARLVGAPGIELATESDPLRAIERLATERFDLVVSDHRMHGADGIAVLTASRACHPDGLRLLMTGYRAIPADLDRVKEMGADGYVQKPLTLRRIVETLRAFAAAEEQALHEFRVHARALERIAEVTGERLDILG